MNKIAVTSQLPSFSIYEESIRLWALFVLTQLHKNGFFLDVYLVDQRRMRFLNKHFRDKDSSTNVLSFVEPVGFIDASCEGLSKAGEIYISPLFVTQKKQSMQLMVVHGMLHLFGFDHKTKKEREEMEKMEDSLLELLGNK